MSQPRRIPYRPGMKTPIGSNGRPMRLVHRSHRKRQRRRRFFTTLTAALVACLAVWWLMPDMQASAEPNAQPARIDDTPENALAIINAPDSTMPDPMDTMPGEGCQRIRVKGLGGPLARVFNDSNYLHYGVARRIGINPVINDSAARYTRSPLVRVSSCNDFYVAPLTHSFPYLVPVADKLLHEIGKRFNDSLRARGGGNYRLKVTSMLRTPQTVRKLRRVNRCATDSSAHQFGTTFDISFTRFMLTKRGGTYRTQEDMKNLLAEIIADLRDKERCYVKYERSGGCFHITARK